MSKKEVKDSDKTEMLKDQMIGWMRNYNERLDKLESEVNSGIQANYDLIKESNTRIDRLEKVLHFVANYFEEHRPMFTKTLRKLLKEGGG